jgi:hypothetical protein
MRTGIEMAAWAGLGLGLVALAGCMPRPMPRYDVHHAALLQPPAPPMWSGKTRASGIALGNSSVLWSDKPELSENGSAGLYVASTQFDGTVHFDLGPSGKVSLWVPMSYGLSDYAFAVRPCLIDTPTGGAFTGGLGVALSSPLAGPWYGGLAFETLLAYIPASIRATCVENCQYADTQAIDKDDWTVQATLRLTLATGLDFGWIRIYAGASLRNHHWNQVSESISTYSPEDIGDTVEFGKPYLLVGGGLEVELGEHVSLLAQVYQPLALMRTVRSGQADEIVYGLIGGLTLDLHFPRS